MKAQCHMKQCSRQVTDLEVQRTKMMWNNKTADKWQISEELRYFLK
jgi:hypothetical protein